MPSIALFLSKFTNEELVKGALASTLNLAIVSDADIISDICGKNLEKRNKLERCLYQKTSVFNPYTLERESNAASLKSSMAARMHQKQNHLYCGFTSLLIPHDVTHVLKVLIVDSREERVARAVAEGISEKEAESLMRAADQSAYSWTDFLYQKEAFDPSLYDIVVPVGPHDPDEVAALIKGHFNKTAVLETADSLQAIDDFALASQVESALVAQGQKVEVEARNNFVTLKVNKSTFSFDRLTEKLTKIAGAVDGVKGVEVQRGKGYRTSVYRDQHFELPPKVLLVDDEREYILTLSERLVSRNVGTYAVFNGQEALDFIDGDRPDVMVLDLKMPGIDGLEVLRQTKKTNPDIEVIILTGHGSEADRQTCMNLGAFAYLQKPTDIEDLSRNINEAYKKTAARN